MKSTRIDGRKLLAAREEAGLTQKSLGELIGVDRSTIAHWESTRPNSKQPSAFAFRALRRALSLDMRDLIEEEAA